MARAAAEARQIAIWQRAASDASRLADADQAYKAGDIALASRLYVRLGLSRTPNESTKAAKDRLVQLADEGRQKLKEIDALLAQASQNISPGELLDQGPFRDDPQMAHWREQVVAAFQQYDRLADDYQGVPVFAGEIKTHVAKQRRRPQHATVLNEPEAKALWEVAQQHESEGHACCAYWVYRKAAMLLPAPSARLAEERFTAMQGDTQLVESARQCREMQQCHKIYGRAERLIAVKPAQARELFAQLVQRAPKDSEVYRAAQVHLRELPP